MKMVKVLEDANNQYDSFLFWRQPIPELDLSELEGLGLIDSSSMKDSKHGKKSSQKKVQEWEEDEEAELSEYNSFNYWREPIASIDLLDFNLLL